MEPKFSIISERCPAEREGGMQVVKVAGVSLWALFREKKEKPRN